SCAKDRGAPHRHSRAPAAETLESGCRNSPTAACPRWRGKRRCASGWRRWAAFGRRRPRRRPPARCARPTSPDPRTTAAHWSFPRAPDNRSPLRRRLAARSGALPPAAPASCTVRRAGRTCGLSRHGAAPVDERLDGIEQLAFLVRLAEIVIDTELDGARPMLLADPRRDHHDGYVLEARVVAHVRGDFVAVHARHFD